MASPDLASHAASCGRPHLGPRTVVTAALWCGLEKVVDEERGNLDRSPYLADLLAWHVGLPSLIRHHQLAITIDTRTRDHSPARADAFEGTTHRTVRVHPAVATQLVARASELDVPRAVYNANAIADLLGVPRMHTHTMPKELPFAR